MLRTGNKRGFTLLELMVALAIMVILSGVVMVSIGSTLEEARLRAGARTVVSMLRYARSYAVSHRTDTAVLFDTERQGISVQIRETDEDGVEGWRTLTTTAGRFRTMPQGIALAEVQNNADGEDVSDEGTEDLTEEGQSAVTFSMLGQATETRITLQNKKQTQLVIVVDGLTGRCELTNTNPNDNDTP